MAMFRLYLVVALAAVFALPSPAQTGSLALSSGTGTPGGTTVLNLALASNGGTQPAGVQWTLTYSPAAKLDRAVKHRNRWVLCACATGRGSQISSGRPP
jgi:hypothetical protein